MLEVEGQGQEYQLHCTGGDVIHQLSFQLGSVNVFLSWHLCIHLGQSVGGGGRWGAVCVCVFVCLFSLYPNICIPYHPTPSHNKVGGKFESPSQVAAEINVLFEPHMTSIISSIEFYLSNFYQAHGNFHDEPTDDVIVSLTSRQFCNEDISMYFSFRCFSVQ